MKDNTILYRVARPLVKIFMSILYSPKIIGKENIPKNGRIVMAGNHTHIFDCFMLMISTKRSIHFLAKKELWKFPKGIIFSHMGLIPVDRKVHDHSALESAINYLNNDMVIGIFPEGTTEKGRGLLPFKIGAVKMAYETNSKIVPFVIKGKYSFFKRNIKIEFGKPIQVKTNDLDKENNKLRNKIKSMLGDDK